jgi:hypothetical protein
MDKPTDIDVEDALDSVRARMDRASEEAIRDIFARFPFGQQIELFTGKKATLKVWHEPKLRDGRWCFGVDMQFNDGSGHLEYTFLQTGWGGTP